MNRRASIVTIGAVACVAPLLAGCDPAAGGEPDASPSASAAASAEDAPVNDPALKLRLAQAEPEIGGYLPLLGVLSPVDSVGAFHAGAVDVVEPASCTAFHQATDLGTDQDLTAAAGDLFNPAGPYVRPEDVDTEPPWDAQIAIKTRIFGSEDLAATLTGILLDADCDAYTRTGTWDTGRQVLEHTVASVSEVDLEGLDTSTVKVAFASARSTLYDEDGALSDADERGAWNHYVHVDGAHAIMVDLLGVDDEEAVVAQAIADILEALEAD